ncbi:MAG TPA: hypothetical protein DER40_06805 [Geobacter sp.]|nr:hypothetical protein [Geobacter sp.]HCE67225.1 hypothetical protein [Geobacter sp.]
MPVQSPPVQPLKSEPTDGFAVSVTMLPFSNTELQLVPQSITAGRLLTVPLPSPAFVMVRLYRTVGIADVSVSWPEPRVRLESSAIVRVLIVAAELSKTVLAPALLTTTLSPGTGTPIGVQLVYAFQSPPDTLFQVTVSAPTRMLIDSMTAVTSNMNQDFPSCLFLPFFIWKLQFAS